MIEQLQIPYIQRALVVGCLVAIVAGYFGALIVQRRMSYLAGGLAHAAFGGVALGIFLSLEPLVVALPYTLAVALAIRWAEERGRIASDTAIGVFFAFSMAVGIALLAKTERFTVDAYAYLFGSLLALDKVDVYTSIGLAAVALATVPLWPRWAYATMDSEFARSEGINTRRDDYLLVAVLAMVTVLSIKLAGMVLAGAFAVVPAAAARLVSRRFATMTLLSIAIGFLSVLAGLAASIRLDLPTGAAIILVQSVVFVGVLVARR